MPCIGHHINMKKKTYNFEQFIVGIRNFEGITLTARGIVITKKFQKYFVVGDWLELVFDKEQRAIGLRTSIIGEGENPLCGERNKFKISKNWIAPCRLSKEMPCGRYYYDIKQEDYFICVNKK
jgi:hypothetical protein